MKFYLLPVGEKFSYQGISYTKCGPLTASNNVNGHNKMIPRSANIKVSADLKLNEAVDINDKNLPASKVANVINTFYQSASENLKDVKTELSEASYNKAKLQLDALYKEALTTLALK